MRRSMAAVCRTGRIVRDGGAPGASVAGRVPGSDSSGVTLHILWLENKQTSLTDTSHALCRHDHAFGHARASASAGPIRPASGSSPQPCPEGGMLGTPLRTTAGRPRQSDQLARQPVSPLSGGLLHLVDACPPMLGRRHFFPSHSFSRRLSSA